MRLCLPPTGVCQLLRSVSVELVPHEWRARNLMHRALRWSAKPRFICEIGALECYVAKDGEEKMVPG